MGVVAPGEKKIVWEGVNWIHVAQAGCYEYDNEHEGFTKCGKFANWLSNCSLPKWDSAQHSWLVAKLDPDFHSCAALLKVIKVFYLPTDAQ